MATMILLLAALQIVTLVVLFVVLRRTSAPAQDPRLNQLADTLPAQLTRLDARSEALDHHLRSELAQLRTDNADQASRTRESAAADFTNLRSEITSNIAELSKLLNTGLNGFRSDNKASDEALRLTVQQNLDSIAQRLNYFIAEVNRNQLDAREALHTRLNELSGEANTQQEKLRFTVEERLSKLNEDNSVKLEEMRVTVDEKLHATLQSRLTESFSAVTEQLTKVHAGLGEMTTLATGVGDLKRVLSNVKSRGIVGEFFLGQQLEQMFSPDQYIHNAQIKVGSRESVEYALKVPNGPDSIVLLALDSKFPQEDWERLEHAYDNGTEEDRKRAGTAFERAILAQAKSICDKYIDPPNTLPFAVMYLPTEALYAEVMRRPGLHAQVQSQFQVVMAGPSAFTMILTSFQLVFRTLKFQKNLNEVWKVFQIAQDEFEKYGKLMIKVEAQVGTVQNTLKEISGKAKTLNRAFKNVSRLELEQQNNLIDPASTQENLLQMLAATDDEWKNP
jgi:DNA recombination protein RmuC